MARLKRVSPQGAAVAAVFAAVFSAALPVDVHVLRDLRDPFHQGAAQTFLGVALLVEVGVVGQHLLAFVDLQLGVELLQLILWKHMRIRDSHLPEQPTVFSGMSSKGQSHGPSDHGKNWPGWFPTPTTSQNVLFHVIDRSCLFIYFFYRPSEQLTRMSSGSKLCSLQADVMLLFR